MNNSLCPADFDSCSFLGIQDYSLSIYGPFYVPFIHGPFPNTLVKSYTQATNYNSNKYIIYMLIYAIYMLI